MSNARRPQGSPTFSVLVTPAHNGKEQGSKETLYRANVHVCAESYRSLSVRWAGAGARRDEMSQVVTASRIGGMSGSVSQNKHLFCGQCAEM